MFWIGLLIGVAVGVFLMGLVVQRKIADQRDITFKLGRELGHGEGRNARDKELRQAYSARGKKAAVTLRSRRAIAELSRMSQELEPEPTP